MSAVAQIRISSRAIALAIFLAATAHAAFAQSGSFHADSGNGCKLWWIAEGTASVASVRWTGACGKGFAQGSGTFEVVETSEYDGRARKITWKGEGVFRDGKLNGRGLMSHGSTRREGEFRDGVLNGRGIVTAGLGANKYRYDGEYRDGLKNGWGVEDREEPVDSRTVTDHTEGQWQNGKLNGKAVWTRRMPGCSAVERYEGQWTNDRYDGAGVLTEADGRNYSGTWVDGQLSGSRRSFGAISGAKIWDACK